MKEQLATIPDTIAWHGEISDLTLQDSYYMIVLSRNIYVTTVVW